MPSAKSDKTCVSGRGRHQKCETNVLKNRKADRLYTDSQIITSYRWAPIIISKVTSRFHNRYPKYCLLQEERNSF
jgi:hypothetical protein